MGRRRTEERKQTIGDRDLFYNIRLQLGRESLKKVERARLVFIGTGGIGSNLALALSGTGFRRFILIDGDKISRRNIPLSNVFTQRNVGDYKVKVVEAFLRSKYGNRIEIRSHIQYSDKVPVEIVTEPDLLFLGVDDQWTRLAITNLRVEANRPYVNLGFYGWEASYMLVIPHRTACWACLWRPRDDERVLKLKREGRCPEPEPNLPGAVIPATVQRLIGFTAGETVKFFTGIGRLAQHYKFNTLTGQDEMRFLSSPDFFKPDPECPICHKEEEIDVSETEWPTD